MVEGFLELWRPLVPPWILQHVLDQLVLVRLQVNHCSCVPFSLVDPDPYVFGPPGSGSVIILYGSGSFYQQAKQESPDFILFCDFFLTFLSLKTDVNVLKKLLSSINLF